ncbi:hypothetical protein ACF1BS_04360 [Streptomyces sp. NPDC014748]|uniref:hypothetical protein n=1 Tax=Streptomyces sp. NPDC014748 TaxID=3364905 RepID=UPI0036F8A611
MTDTTVNPYPTTPATVAAAILDAIERHPDALDMGNWAHIPAGDLKPDDEIQCGTTMCIAGWAAHLTGYTLHCYGDNDVEAVKDGVAYPVEEAATQALGLTLDANGMFWLHAQDALAELRRIAGR